MREPVERKVWNSLEPAVARPGVAALLLARSARRRRLIRLVVATALVATVGVEVYRVLAKNLRGSSRKTTVIVATEFATTAYDEWRLAGGEGCPTISALAPYTNQGGTADAWGNPFLTRCEGDVGLPGDVPFGVQSAGEDGVFDTEDDIRSWERYEGRYQVRVDR